jgi:hypothetical protein
MSDFFDAMDKAFARASGAALEAMGKHLAEKMKEPLEGKHEDTGRLRDSITWATKDATGRDLVGPSAEESDVISQPESVGVLHIGTAVPYAPPVEYGSGPHVANGEQSQEFTDRLTDWARRHGFAENDIYYLIQYIRKNGTEQIEFINPTKQYAEGAGSAALNDIIRRFMREEFKKIPKTTKTIEWKIDIPRGNK